MGWNFTFVLHTRRFLLFFSARFFPLFSLSLSLVLLFFSLFLVPLFLLSLGVFYFNFISFITIPLFVIVSSPLPSFYDSPSFPIHYTPSLLLKLHLSLLPLNHLLIRFLPVSFILLISSLPSSFLPFFPLIHLLLSHFLNLLLIIFSP